MASPPPVLTLAVEKGPREGETRQCRAGATLRVGRVVKGNDLAVRDTGASQQHLAIEFLPPPDARWTVSDLRSSNGTLLNGVPLVLSVPAILSHGDVIKVGDSTVLAVSIASDSDPTPCPTRSSRHAAAAVVPVVPVVEEKPPLVTRRGTRKKAAAAAALDPPVAEKEKPDAAEVVVEEKTQALTRRGGREKVAAAELSGEVEEAVEATRRGVRKKVVKVPEQEKDVLEEATVIRRGSKRKKVAEPPEQEKEKEAATVVTRRSRRKKPAELPEQEKEDAEALALAHHGEMKKDSVSVAPLLGPPKTRSGRGQGRVTRGSAKNTVLEVDEEEQGENELAASRACTENHLTSMAMKGGNKKKGKNVTAVDGEVEVIAKALREEVRKGRASSQHAASGKGANVSAAVPHEETEEVAEVMLHGRRKKAIKLAEPEKEEKEKEKEGDVTVATRRGGQKKDTVVTHCGRRKPDLVVIAPQAMPATTRYGRGQGRVTRAGQRSIVLEENNKEEQEESEVDAPGQRITNLVNALIEHDGEEQMVNKVAAGDGQAQGPAKPLEEEVSNGRANGQGVASANGASAAVVEPPEEMDNAAVATRRGGRKKATVVTVRGRRKKDVAMIAPPTLPAKTRSVRGRGRVTRASARNAVLEDDKEEHEENEVAEPRENGNPPRAMALNVGQEEKGHDIAAGDGEAQGTASRADSGSNGIPNTTSKYREDRKLKAHSTPFDIRLDRALKKYSA